MFRTLAKDDKLGLGTRHPGQIRVENFVNLDKLGLEPSPRMTNQG